MRILVIDNSPQMGGSIRCLATLLAELIDHEIAIGVSASRPELFTQLLGDRIQLLNVDWIGFRDVFNPSHGLVNNSLPVIGTSLALRRFARHLLPSIEKNIEQFKPDLAIVNNLNLPQIPIYQALHRHKIPFIVYARMIRLFGRRELMGAALANRVLCVSRAVRDYLHSCKTIPDSKLTFIYDGIEEALFSAAPNPDLRTELNWPKAAPVVVLVGRLSPWKGQHVALAAWPQVREQFPEALLAVVGEGEPEYTDLLKRQAIELNLGDSVNFVGHRNDIPQVLAAGTLQLHTSCYADPRYGTVEAFGRVVIEAMAMRRAVIATAAGGVPELVMDGETGLLIRPNDPVDLAEKVIRALSDPTWRQQAGKAGRTRAERLYTQREATQQTLELFSNILAAARR